MITHPEQIQSLAEILRTSTQFAADTLADMLEQPVSIQLEQVSRVHQPALEQFLTQEVGGAACVAGLGFTGSATGMGMLLLPAGHDVLLLSACLREEDNPVISDELKISTLQEVGNVILNACIGMIANGLDVQVRYQIPVLIFRPTEEQLRQLAGMEQHSEWLLMTSRMSVGEQSMLVYILVMFRTPGDALKQ